MKTKGPRKWKIWSLNKLLSELLGLEDIKITDIKLQSDNTFLIRVKSTKEETACRQCGGPTKPHGQGRTLALRHPPILGKECIIEITRTRGICERYDVKVMKRRCYGIFNLKHFFQRLFLDLSGYRIYLKNQVILANC